MNKLEELYQTFQKTDVNDDFFAYKQVRDDFMAELDSVTAEWHTKYGVESASRFMNAAIKKQPCPICGDELSVTESGQRADSKHYFAHAECAGCALIATSSPKSMLDFGIIRGRETRTTDEWTQARFKNAPRDPRKIYEW